MPGVTRRDFSLYFDLGEEQCVISLETLVGTPDATRLRQHALRLLGSGIVNSDQCDAFNNTITQDNFTDLVYRLHPIDCSPSSLVRSKLLQYLLLIEEQYNSLIWYYTYDNAVTLMR